MPLFITLFNKQASNITHSRLYSWLLKNLFYHKSRQQQEPYFTVYIKFFYAQITGTMCKLQNVYMYQQLKSLARCANYKILYMYQHLKSLPRSIICNHCWGCLSLHSLMSVQPHVKLQPTGQRGRVTPPG